MEVRQVLADRLVFPFVQETNVDWGRVERPSPFAGLADAVQHAGEGNDRCRAKTARRTASGPVLEAELLPPLEREQRLERVTVRAGAHCRLLVPLAPAAGASLRTRGSASADESRAARKTVARPLKK